MIIKIVLLFLVAIGLLGMTGRFRPKQKKPTKNDPVIQPARKCPHCGTYLVGDDPCTCRSSRPS